MPGWLKGSAARARKRRLAAEAEAAAAEAATAATVPAEQASTDAASEVRDIFALTRPTLDSDDTL